jgi:nicotinic acetylcholine receptor
VRDLFRGYNKLIRPVQNMTQKVEVAFGLAFIQLINVVGLRRAGGGLRTVL